MGTVGSSGRLPPQEVHRDEVDGVPVFWIEVDGPRTAALMFGVGRSHERATTTGISHLVEHLALAPLTQQEFSHNGFVSPTRTVFHATGTDQELVGYFRSVTGSLVDLPLARLGMERRILRQEGRDRNPGIPALLMWFRFGNQGHGLNGVAEIGLDWLGPTPVQDWAQTKFGRRRAAICFSARPPDDLRLTLPEGDPPSAPAIDSITLIRSPSYFSWTSDRVSLSYLASASPAAQITLEVIARRTRELLRFERGLVYDINTDFELLDATTAHCTLSTDCRRDQADTVRDELVREIDAVARDGLTTDEVKRELRALNETLALPRAQLSVLNGIAIDRIMGAPFQSVEEVLAEYESIDGSSAGAELEQSLGTLLLCAPGPLPNASRWTPYEQWSPEWVHGRTFRPPGRRVAGVRLPSRAPEETLIVGADGVTWRSPAGKASTVRFESCVACRHWQEDHRELWGADGFRVRINAAEWRDGMDAVRLVDAAVARDVVVCDEHGVGAYLDPADRSQGGR